MLTEIGEHGSTQSIVMNMLKTLKNAWQRFLNLTRSWHIYIVLHTIAYFFLHIIPYHKEPTVRYVPNENCFPRPCCMLSILSIPSETFETVRWWESKPYTKPLWMRNCVAFCGLRCAMERHKKPTLPTALQLIYAVFDVIVFGERHNFEFPDANWSTLRRCALHGIHFKMVSHCVRVSFGLFK